MPRDVMIECHPKLMLRLPLRDKRPDTGSTFHTQNCLQSIWVPRLSSPANASFPCASIIPVRFQRVLKSRLAKVNWPLTFFNNVRRTYAHVLPSSPHLRCRDRRHLGRPIMRTVQAVEKIGSWPIKYTDLLPRGKPPYDPRITPS